MKNDHVLAWILILRWSYDQNISFWNEYIFASKLLYFLFMVIVILIFFSSYFGTLSEPMSTIFTGYKKFCGYSEFNCVVALGIVG